MKFIHLGHAITVSASGSFCTVINKQTITKPTLTAIKKAISDSLKTPFKRVPALRKAIYGEKGDKDGLIPVTIIGVQKGRRHNAEFVIEKPDGSVTATSHELLIDSPENRAARRAAKAYRDESRKIDEKREKEQRRLDELVKKFDADNYQQS